MGRLFDEFAVGQRFLTPGRTITETDIVNYSGLTGDYNPVHTDELFAVASGFGGRIAHGPMGIGLAFGLAARLDLLDGTVVALLGVTWDFMAPMRPGSTVRCSIEVSEKRDVKREDCGLLGLLIEIMDQDNLVLQKGSAKILMRRCHLELDKWGMIADESGKPQTREAR